MGKKADQVRDELESEINALERRVRELDDENRRLRDGAATIPDPPGMRAAAEMHRQNQALAVLEPDHDPVERAAASDLQAIEELHRPVTPDGKKPETALDVVRANNAERSTLHGTAVRNNALISRIASALRVTTWDADGTEILEKCQQWATFAHWLQQRQKVATGAVANELATVLTALLAPADLARWVMEKTAEAVPESALEVASTPDVAQTGGFLGTPITREDLVWIRDAVAAYALDRRELDKQPWLGAALKTERGTNELLAVLNMVLLPFLRRLRVVSETPLARGN